MGGVEESPMATDRNVWMEIHRLYSTMDSLGLNRDERISEAMKHYMDLPPTVRRELHASIRTLSIDLFEMLPAIAAAEQAANEGGRKKTGAA
jgi:hypothetical protein